MKNTYSSATYAIVLFSDLFSPRIALVLQPLLFLSAQAQCLSMRQCVLPHAAVAAHRDQSTHVVLNLDDRPHLVPVLTTYQIASCRCLYRVLMLIIKEGLYVNLFILKLHYYIINAECYILLHLLAKKQYVHANV